MLWCCFVHRLRLLREVAHLRALRHLACAEDVGVDAGEDLEERGLACAVRADHADVGPVEEAEVDVLQDRLHALLLRHVYERELVFACHFCLSCS